MLLYNILLVLFGLIILLYYPTQFCSSHNITTLCDYNIVAQFFSTSYDDIPVKKLSISDLLQLQEVVANNMQGHTIKLEQLWNVENSLQSLLNNVDNAQLNYKCKSDIQELVASIRHSIYQVEILIKNLEHQNRVVMGFYVFYVRSLTQILDNYDLEQAPLKIFEHLSNELAINMNGDLKQLHAIVSHLNWR